MERSPSLSNITGNANTADGVVALYNNTTGGHNTAIGWQVLHDNTTGSNNTATGVNALIFNFTGDDNTANGYQAGFNITGSGNVCIGADVFGVVGLNNTTWIRNVNTLSQVFSAGVNDYVTVRLSDGRLGHTAACFVTTLQAGHQTSRRDEPGALRA